MGKECAKQMPYRGTNVTREYRLTDRFSPNDQVRQAVERLTYVPEIQVVTIGKTQVECLVTFSPKLGVFSNAIHIAFTNLLGYDVSCVAKNTLVNVYTEWQDMVMNVSHHIQLFMEID